MADKNIAFRVRRNYEKPDPDFLKTFKGLSTGNICDANGRIGALDYHIKPLVNTWKFIGTAFTVHARPVDNLILYKALDLVESGDVIIITNGGSSYASVLGDLVCGIAKSKGVAAIVTDGMVRDASGIREVNMPVFARGVCPNSPHKDGPGEINFPIACGGVAIHPGDIVVGDEDGVVVVAQQDLHDVIGNFGKIRAKENEMQQIIKTGWTLPEWMEKDLKNKGISYCDE